MDKYEHFKGIIPPVSTIFDTTGQFDKENMGKLIDKLINSGVDGLLILGSGGEFNELKTEERKLIAKYSIEYVSNRVPVFIGTGSNQTKEAIDLTKHAKQSGADGVFVINPYYWQLNETDLFQYYDDIAKAVDIPIFVYNFPDLTGQSISAELVLKLVNENKNIIGIKETIDSIAHIGEMINIVKQKHPYFKVFAGLDIHLLNTLFLGGDGVIPGTANFAPQITVNLINAHKNGDIKVIEQLQRKVVQLHDVFKIKSPVYTSVKAAINECMMPISTVVQPPAQQLNESELENLQKILKEVNLI